MQITKHKVVSIDYTLTDDEGVLIDSSDGHEPLRYLHGVGGIIPGLEQALEDLSVGDEFAVVIAPADAYGELEDGMRSEVPRTQFDDVDDLELGMQFRVPTDEGDHQVVTVVEISDEAVTIDGNHPLAGATLHFEVTVRDVREATQDEIKQGYADNE
jgi:FKBP-type peptidyl-prolyl cis-trans isomerase SlyD